MSHTPHDNTCPIDQSSHLSSLDALLSRPKEDAKALAALAFAVLALKERGFNLALMNYHVSKKYLPSTYR